MGLGDGNDLHNLVPNVIQFEVFFWSVKLVFVMEYYDPKIDQERKNNSTRIWLFKKFKLKNVAIDREEWEPLKIGSEEEQPNQNRLMKTNIISPGDENRTNWWVGINDWSCQKMKTLHGENLSWRSTQFRPSQNLKWGKNKGYSPNQNWGDRKPKGSLVENPRLLRLWKNFFLIFLFTFETISFFSGREMSAHFS